MVKAHGSTVSEGNNSRHEGFSFKKLEFVLVTDIGPKGGCVCRCANVNRRTLVGGIAAVALAGTVGRVNAQDDPTTMPPQLGDFLAFTTDDSITPLTAEAIELGFRPQRAWPVDPETMTPRNGTLYNLLMVSRWDPDTLTEEAKLNAADGVVALTAICTHAACDVSDWVEDAEVMECPCHFSQFDPRANGAVIMGPATRRLPALKLGLSDGKIVVASSFDSRVGGDEEG